MKNLTNKTDREKEVKKEGHEKNFHLEDYQKMIADEEYLDDAIYKIASDLSHYLTK
jgi:hypothetical protein